MAECTTIRSTLKFLDPQITAAAFMLQRSYGRVLVYTILEFSYSSRVVSKRVDNRSGIDCLIYLSSSLPSSTRTKKTHRVANIAR
jgi:hypothetical protein